MSRHNHERRHGHKPPGFRFMDNDHARDATGRDWISERAAEEEYGIPRELTRCHAGLEIETPATPECRSVRRRVILGFYAETIGIPLGAENEVPILAAVAADLVMMDTIAHNRASKEERIRGQILAAYTLLTEAIVHGRMGRRICLVLEEVIRDVRLGLAARTEVQAEYELYEASARRNGEAAQ